MKKFDFVQDPDKTGDDAVVVSDRKRRKIEIVPLIVCFLIAVVVWLWMVNLNDTDAQEVKLLTIEYVGMQDPVDGNLMFYGIDKTEISVTVQGSNRDLKKYEDKEYHAIVDLSGFDPSKMKEGEKVTLPITIKVPENSSLRIVGSNDLSATMLVDRYTVKSVPFDVIVDKTHDDTNTYDKAFTIADNDGTEGYITIAGPSRLVNLISYARYNISSELLKKADGTFEDTKTFTGTEENNFPLSFLNEHYHVVNGTEGIVTYSTNGAVVVVNVIEHKEIPVRVEIRSDTPTTDLIANTNPSSIKIYGSPSVLADISEYVIKMNNAVENAIYTQNIELPGAWALKGVKIENAESTIQITFTGNAKDNE